MGCYKSTLKIFNNMRKNMFNTISQSLSNNFQDHIAKANRSKFNRSIRRTNFRDKANESMINVGDITISTDGKKEYCLQIILPSILLFFTISIEIIGRRQ
jgi:predicted HAD superfamily phosphohydrolase YqeG